MLRVFPVAAEGRPHFTDDYGYVKPGAARGHQGIDIFADEGAPVFAVDDGALRFAEDPLGGHAFYLASSTNRVTYYGAHLSAYEGASRQVRAGEVIGYVGATGNAAGTSPHLHFESHPGGGQATEDPYALLSALTPLSAVSGRADPGGVVPVPALPPAPSRDGWVAAVAVLGGVTLAVAASR